MLTVAHIALSVSSIRKTAAFYGKCFGFRLVKTYSFKDPGMTIAVLKKDGNFLELFEFRKRKQLPAYRRNVDTDLRTLGVKHFAFGVRDAAREYRRLKKAGAKFATPVRTFADGKRYFFLRDPDGMLVEVMEE